MLDLLGGLVDKSLVVAGATTSGALRYRMLEPIRQYAQENCWSKESKPKRCGTDTAPTSSRWPKKPNRS